MFHIAISLRENAAVFSLQHLICSVRRNAVCARPPIHPVQTRKPGGVESIVRDPVMTRILFILIALWLPVGALAQNAPPKVGKNLLAQVKPKEPMGCKLVGTVRGIKLWAGDCVGAELRGSTTTPDNQAMPEERTGSITPEQKD